MSRGTRSFYLVQRLNLSPYKRFAEAFPNAKVKSNPFGGGRLGDYELDYMGAAEFEWGAVPTANNRLADAKGDLCLAEHEYRGHMLEFLFIGSEGDPFEDFKAWAEGRGKYEPPFYGKETPYELRNRLDGREPSDPERGWSVALWWALEANVIWGFKEDGHMTRWLKSMSSAPSELR